MIVDYSLCTRSTAKKQTKYECTMDQELENDAALFCVTAILKQF